MDVLNQTDTINELTEVNRQLRKQVYQLRNLVDVSFRLHSSFEEDVIIHKYLLNLFGLLSTKSLVVLMSHGPYSRTLAPVYYQGMTKSQAEALKIDVTDEFIKSILRPNAETDVVWIEKAIRKNGGTLYPHTVHSCGGKLVAPIIHRNYVLGLVVIGEKHNQAHYSASEAEILSLLTSFLAVAISNSRIYKHMERVSLTDPLTGLFNRRYFEDFLQNEVARARRSNHPLSLIMLDVDNFKNYNDQLGHPSGDVLLKNIARIMTRTVRCSDFVARYGGEEFCIILPEISHHGAYSFSERLRDIICSHPFERREIQPDGRVTISVGTATFPKDAHIVKDLIEKADRALYHAKSCGRNRVAAYATS